MVGAFRATAALGALALLCGACLVTFDEGLIDRRSDGPEVDQGGDAVTDGRVDQGDQDGGVNDTICTDELGCEGGNLVRCGKVISTCPLDCLPIPEPRCRSFVPSNNVPSPGSAGEELLDPLVIQKAAVLDSCSGEIDGAMPSNVVFSVVEQQSGPTIGVLQLHSFTVAAAAGLKVIGGCALAIVAYREILIEGAIDAGGGQNAPYVGGPGGYQGSFVGSAQGCGPGKDGDPDLLGGGGGGGFSTTGGSGGSSGGDGGAPCDLGTLSPLVGGSGGGHGGCSSTSCTGGHGGGGGGALALVAGERVHLAGGIVVAGGGGEGGVVNVSGGGGGGSGGALLIEAPDVLIDSSAIINVGGGGGGGVSSDSAAKARGSRGLLTLAPAGGGVGLATGGNGSVGSANGAGGSQADGGGGGGGGGGGYVRINTATGSVTLPSLNGVATEGLITVLP